MSTQIKLIQIIQKSSQSDLFCCSRLTCSWLNCEKDETNKELFSCWWSSFYCTLIFCLFKLAWLDPLPPGRALLPLATGPNQAPLHGQYRILARFFATVAWSDPSGQHDEKMFFYFKTNMNENFNKFFIFYSVGSIIRLKMI